MSDINTLKEGVAELKAEILHLQNERTREALLTDTCHGDNDVGVSLSCALRAQTQLFAEVVIGTSSKTSLAPP